MNDGDPWKLFMNDGRLKLATSDDGGVGRSTLELGHMKFPNRADFRGSAALDEIVQLTKTLISSDD